MNSETKSQDVGVLIVDDSAFMRMALSCMISSGEGFHVVGTAATRLKALEKLPMLDPDVITLDVEMAGIDGLRRFDALCRNSRVR